MYSKLPKWIEAAGHVSPTNGHTLTITDKLTLEHLYDVLTEWADFAPVARLRNSTQAIDISQASANPNRYHGPVDACPHIVFACPNLRSVTLSDWTFGGCPYTPPLASVTTLILQDIYFPDVDPSRTILDFLEGFPAVENLTLIDVECADPIEANEIWLPGTLRSLTIQVSNENSFDGHLFDWLYDHSHKAPPLTTLSLLDIDDKTSDIACCVIQLLSLNRLQAVTVTIKPGNTGAHQDIIKLSKAPELLGVVLVDEIDG